MFNYDRIINNLQVLKQKAENPSLQIEVKSYKSNCFHELVETELSFYWFLSNELRIKPNPEWRPYKKVERWWIGDILIFKKSEVGNLRRAFMIVNVNEKLNTVILIELCKKSNVFSLDLDFMFQEYIYKIDNQPFGELKEGDL